MKILIIIDSLGGGGAERSTQVLCEYLDKKGVSFEIVCLYFYPNGFHQEMIDKGYKITFLEKKSFFGQSMEIGKIISNGKFDLVHSILFKSNLRTRLAKIFTNFVHLESLVNTTYSEERKFDNKVNQKLLAIYKIVDRYSAKVFVDHFHSITNSVKNHYVAHLKIDTKNITVVYRGRKKLELDLDIREKRDPNKFILLNVARQDYQKGQIFLLQAMKKLKEDGRTDIKLINIGVEGSETADLNRYVKEHNLNSTVEFAGFSNNVAEYFSIADVFIFSSLFEGLGGALIEAQSAGLPIISNDIEVLREVVQKDLNGLLVNIKETDQVVKAIIRLRESPELRKSFEIESLKNYQNKFKQETSNRNMLELYKKLC